MCPAGHWKLRHTPMLFAVGVAVMLLQFSLFAFIRNSGGLFRSFGFGDLRPAIVSLMLFQSIIGPLDEVRRRAVGRRAGEPADGRADAQGRAG